MLTDLRMWSDDHSVCSNGSARQFPKRPRSCCPDKISRNQSHDSSSEERQAIYWNYGSQKPPKLAAYQREVIRETEAEKEIRRVGRLRVQIQEDVSKIDATNRTPNSGKKGEEQPHKI
jgi:hypothetical protein